MVTSTVPVKVPAVVVMTGVTALMVNALVVVSLSTRPPRTA